MSDIVRAVSSTTVAKGWGTLAEHRFELRRRDGRWQHQVRETYDRGDGASVLLCDIAAGVVIITRQLRNTANNVGDTPQLLEASAGKHDGDKPETCSRREAMEETGYRSGRLDRVWRCFMSPGAVTERLTLFIGIVDGPADAAGGGLEHEGEDIEVVRLPFATALGMIGTGEIADAKTIILLQYAALNRVFG